MFEFFKKAPNVRPDILNLPLLNLTRRDTITVGDLLNGGVSVFGQTGSGKSSGSGRALAQAVVNFPKSGGLIHGAKPEDPSSWSEIFAAAGRSDDLLIFRPESHLRFDFLEFVTRSGGHARNITKTIMVIGETLRSSDNKGGGEDGDFWERQTERMIYNAVVPLKIAAGKVTAPELQKFITTAAHTPQSLSSEHWQGSLHNRILKAAFEADKSDIDKHDLELVMDYWLGEFPQMAEKTRSSILVSVLGILHTFNTGIVRQLVSSGTNVSPDDMFRGKWVLVDMPPSEWGDIGNFINAGWKFLTQRAVLRRHVKSDEPPVIIWADEAHQFVTSADAHFLAQCRSHRGCSVYITQSLPSCYSVLKGHAGKHQADSLLSNFHIKIFHSLGDSTTAEWGSGLLGKSLQTFVGGSVNRDQGAFDTLLDTEHGSSSFSEHFEAVLQPREFMTGLRTGGPENNFICDAIVIRAGKPFASGQNWLKVGFSQR